MRCSARRWAGVRAHEARRIWASWSLMRSGKASAASASPPRSWSVPQRHFSIKARIANAHADHASSCSMGGGLGVSTLEYLSAQLARLPCAPFRALVNMTALAYAASNIVPSTPALISQVAWFARVLATHAHLLRTHNSCNNYSPFNLCIEQPGCWIGTQLAPHAHLLREHNNYKLTIVLFDLCIKQPSCLIHTHACSALTLSFPHA